MMTKSPKSGDLKFSAPPCASGWMILRTMVSAFDGMGTYASNRPLCSSAKPKALMAIIRGLHSG